jgi:threonine/homoserine/homoserine lactone efflux protein
MMPWSYLVKGLVLGFSIAAPVGPIGILCIRRTLAEGRAHGFSSGLGAATADALYGAIAGLGVASAAQLLVAQQVWIRLVGGLFLLYLGVRTVLARPAEKGAPLRTGSLLAAYGSTFLLTLTNPLTILSFAAVFAGLGLADRGGGYASAGLLVAGVFLGSALWWLFLSATVGLLRTRLRPSALRWVNRASGGAIVGFGLYALCGLLPR